MHPPGYAPVIDVQTLSDSYSFFGWAGERPDGETPGDKYRLYQVAGSSHIWTSQVDYTPGPADLVRAGFPANDWQDNCLEPNNPFPLEYQLNAAWDNLDRWVRSGIPPPHAPTSLRSATAPRPRRYSPTSTATRSAAFAAPPSMKAQLQQLYPSHNAYVQAVQSDVDNLRGGRWLTKEDAAAIVSRAQSAQIP
jgi:alpha/beta hydrolase family protein